MLIGAHQPLFIPWIGYFDKINRVDLFVIVDDVQFTSSGWIRRNSIKGSLGPLTLNVPIKKRILLETKINEVRIDNQMNSIWKKCHLKSIQLNYGRAKYFLDFFSQLSNLYEKHFEMLSDLNIEIIKLICSYLEIKTKIVLSSEIKATGHKTDLIIDLCEKNSATSFMLGMGGSNNYADRDKIESKGIKIVQQNFIHPFYSQLFGEFIPNLSVLDLIFNEGPNSCEILNKSTN